LILRNQEVIDGNIKPFELMKKLGMNNITEFDIFSHEEDIEKVSKRIKENGRLIDNTNVLFEALNRM